MNKNETIVKDYLEGKGYKVRKINMGYMPDFIVNEEFYVEVKCLDNYKGGFLSNNQEIMFSKIKEKIIILYVKEGKISHREIFEPLSLLPEGTRTINETFTDEEFKVLLDLKGKLSWHDFIMQLSGENNAPNR